MTDTDPTDETCQNCGDKIDGYPLVDHDTGETYCDIVCAIAEQTGRPREEIESEEEYEYPPPRELLDGAADE